MLLLIVGICGAIGQAIVWFRVGGSRLVQQSDFAALFEFTIERFAI
jgi:hypothetical protein